MELLQLALFWLIVAICDATFLDSRKESLGLQSTSKSLEKACDFNGKTLNAITVEEKPYIIFNQSCMVNLNSTSEGFIKVTSCIDGWIMDTAIILAKKCNFTLDIFTKEGMIFGDAIEIENGSKILTGQFKEIERFDMILHAVFITLPRLDIVRFLYPLGHDRMAIFIQNNVGQQNNWSMYTRIFSFEVWMTLLATLLFPTILISLKDILVNKNQVCSLMKLFQKFSASLALNLGGNFFSSKDRATILLCHLSYGIIIWICIRASLTSKLTKRIYDYPFRTLEELSSTKYSLLTLENGTTAANVFVHAPHGSTEHKVYQNNMNKDSFMEMDEMFERILTESYKAGFMSEKAANYDLAQKFLYCRTLIPWRSKITIPFSIGINKKLQQYEALDLVTKRTIQSGLAKKFEAKYNRIVPSHCDPESPKITIGYERIFPIFLILLCGMCASVIFMFILEIPSNIYRSIN